MAGKKWNEEGRIWEADHGLLDEEQIAQCARADEAETFRSPIPTQMVSNGEYMPVKISTCGSGGCIRLLMWAVKMEIPDHYLIKGEDK
jgi:hypothetical protein